MVVGADKLHPSGVFMESGVSTKDVVVFKTFGSDDLKLDGVGYKIVPFENIRGVIK